MNQDRLCSAASVARSRSRIGEPFTRRGTAAAGVQPKARPVVLTGHARARTLPVVSPPHGIIGSMTLLVGMHLGSYVIIAADTRASWYTPKGKFGYRDDAEKVRETDLGLITGAGLANILDPVKDALATNDHGVRTTHDLEALMRNAREAYRDEVDWWNAKPYLWEAFEITGWLFTYQGGDSPTAETCTLRLACASGSDGFRCRLIAPDQVYVSTPTGLAQEQVDAFRDWINEQLIPLASPSDFSANLNHHIGLIREVMKAVADLNDGVSAQFQVGVHTHGVPGGGSYVGISQIVADDKFNLALTPF